MAGKRPYYLNGHIWYVVVGAIHTTPTPKHLRCWVKQIKTECDHSLFDVHYIY